MTSLNERTENGNVTARMTGPTDVPTNVRNNVNVLTLRTGGLLMVRTLGSSAITILVVTAKIN